jgi:hypothetical protein
LEEGWTTPAQEGGLAPVGREVLWKRGRRVNKGQKMCIHASKCNNDTYWNYSRYQGRREWRKIVEEMNSHMMYLIHYKNLWKCQQCAPTNNNNTGKKTKSSQCIDFCFFVLLQKKKMSMFVLKTVQGNCTQRQRFW